MNSPSERQMGLRPDSDIVQSAEQNARRLEGDVLHQNSRTNSSRCEKCELAYETVCGRRDGCVSHAYVG